MGRGFVKRSWETTLTVTLIEPLTLDQLVAALHQRISNPVYASAEERFD